jgi:hypothetical protein
MHAALALRWHRRSTAPVRRRAHVPLLRFVIVSLYRTGCCCRKLLSEPRPRTVNDTRCGQQFFRVTEVPRMPCQTRLHAARALRAPVGGHVASSRATAAYRHAHTAYRYASVAAEHRQREQRRCVRGCLHAPSCGLAGELLRRRHTRRTQITSALHAATVNCCKAHQTEDWRSHKAACKAAADGASPPAERHRRTTSRIQDSSRQLRVQCQARVSYAHARCRRRLFSLVCAL